MNDVAKKILRYLLLLFIVTLLVFLLSSFFFYPLYFIPSFAFLFLFTFLYALLEKREGGEGYVAALFCGIWMDVLSPFPVGVGALVFLFLVFFIKLVLKRYVKIFSFS